VLGAQTGGIERGVDDVRLRFGGVRIVAGGRLVDDIVSVDRCPQEAGIVLGCAGGQHNHEPFGLDPSEKIGGVVERSKIVEAGRVEVVVCLSERVVLVADGVVDEAIRPLTDEAMNRAHRHSEPLRVERVGPRHDRHVVAVHQGSVNVEQHAVGHSAILTTRSPSTFIRVARILAGFLVIRAHQHEASAADRCFRFGGNPMSSKRRGSVMAQAITPSAFPRTLG
jgi:hypothetical protein